MKDKIFVFIVTIGLLSIIVLVGVFYHSIFTSKMLDVNAKLVLSSLSTIAICSFLLRLLSKDND